MPEPKHKHTIFYVFKDEPFLSPTRGDRINELYFLQALTKHFTVHYNGIPFSPGDTTAGDPAITVAPPSDHYDLYIVRTNADLFDRLPAPKATMAYPYDERAFASADALLSTTNRWVELLETWNDSDDHLFGTSWYPARIVRPKKIITIGQLPSPGFSPLSADHPDIQRYRHLYTNAPFVIGFFGRLDQNEHAPVYFSAMEKLASTGDDTLTVIANPYPWEITSTANALHIGNLPHTDMPCAMAACDLTLSGEEPDNEWLGARKVLEAISVGVPVLTMPWSARIEQLGSDYPLFYDSAESLTRLVSKYRADPDFQQAVHDHLTRRREKLTFGTMADTLAEKLRPLLHTRP